MKQDRSCLQHIDVERVKNIIIHISSIAWDQKASYYNLEKWLGNFRGEALGNVEDERAIAAWLLMNFTYYNQKEVQELCKNVYEKYIHRQLELDLSANTAGTIKNIISEILHSTIFVSLGNPSESGSMLLYDFRNINRLPKSSFASSVSLDAIKKDGKRLAIIDDVSLTGSQASTYLKDVCDKGLDVTLLLLLTTNKAIFELKKKYPDLHILYAMLLDERTELFHEDSYFFADKQCYTIKKPARILCEYYGRKAVSGLSDEYERNTHPLGFQNSQQMFGFYYNTPNNTLPIFWAETEEWAAIFPRKIKVYNYKGVEIYNDKYW